MNQDIVRQAVEKTIGCRAVVLDTGSQGKQEERKPILEVIEKNHIELIKLK